MIDLTPTAPLEQVPRRHYLLPMARRIGLLLGLLVLLTIGYGGHEARAGEGTVIVAGAAAPAFCDGCDGCSGGRHCNVPIGFCASVMGCTTMPPLGVVEGYAYPPTSSADLRIARNAIGPPGLAVKPPLHPPKDS